MTLEIQLPAELQSYVEEKLDSGEFKSPADVVLAALAMQRSLDQKTADAVRIVQADLNNAWHELSTTTRHRGVDVVEAIRERLLKANPS